MFVDMFDAVPIVMFADMFDAVAHGLWVVEFSGRNYFN